MEVASRSEHSTEGYSTEGERQGVTGDGRVGQIQTERRWPEIWVRNWLGSDLTSNIQQLSIPNEKVIPSTTFDAPPTPAHPLPGSLQRALRLGH